MSMSILCLSVCLPACTALHSISRYARSLRSRAPLRPPVGLLSVYLGNFRFLLRVLLDLPGSMPALGSLWQSWGVFGWPLGGVGACWGGLGTFWGVLGHSWSVLGPSWSVLGRSWSVLKGSWGVKSMLFVTKFSLLNAKKPYNSLCFSMIL